MLTFDHYRSVWDNSSFWRAFGNTMLLGVAGATATMALGGIVAYVTSRTRWRGRRLIDLLAWLPWMMPGMVLGVGFLWAFAMLPGPIPIYGTIWIVVIAMATQYVSLGTRLTTSGIVQIQETLEKAGATSGAAMRTVWRRILVPLLRPAFVNAFLLVFLASIQNLTLPLMLQSPDNIVASTLLWGHWDRGNVTSAAVLSVVMTIITVLAAGFLRNTTRKM
jgi:iron(III) transport system permease protein